MSKNNREESEQKRDKSLTKRSENFSQWYLEVVEAADLAEHGPVKGTMVIKPYGYALWENIQKTVDGMFKKTGVENVYFPLFIPESFLRKEREHVQGFAPEVAVVTQAGGKRLEEPLIVRPTSETIMYDAFSRWIHSYKDLPLLLNQWANVVRWELRPRLFLRTTEFLWQEGHTVHATAKEAEERTLQMLNVYKDFVENYLALSVIAGRKSEAEKFAGAVYTTTIEAMMQDGKALQAGTSHFLGQNFAKVFNVKFLREDGRPEYGWQTSWGVSTRLIGAVILAHGDDFGLVLPPKIAPWQVVIVPIWTEANARALVFKKAEEASKQLQAAGIRVKIDDRESRPGVKFFAWEKKGVPLRLEIGPKDVAQNLVVVVRRDCLAKVSLPTANLAGNIKNILADMQQAMYERSVKFRGAFTHTALSWPEFKNILADKGGFIWAHWCGRSECEAKIKEETKATIRCLPLAAKIEPGKCVLCAEPAEAMVIFAKAY